MNYSAMEVNGSGKQSSLSQWATITAIVFFIVHAPFDNVINKVKTGFTTSILVIKFNVCE